MASKEEIGDDVLNLVAPSASAQICGTINQAFTLDDCDDNGLASAKIGTCIRIGSPRLAGSDYKQGRLKRPVLMRQVQRQHDSLLVQSHAATSCRVESARKTGGDINVVVVRAQEAISHTNETGCDTNSRGVASDTRQEPSTVLFNGMSYCSKVSKATGNPSCHYSKTCMAGDAEKESFCDVSFKARDKNMEGQKATDCMKSPGHTSVNRHKQSGSSCTGDIQQGGPSSSGVPEMRVHNRNSRDTAPELNVCIKSCAKSSHGRKSKESVAKSSTGNEVDHVNKTSGNLNSRFVPGSVPVHRTDVRLNSSVSTSGTIASISACSTSSLDTDVTVCSATTLVCDSPKPSDSPDAGSSVSGTCDLSYANEENSCSTVVRRSDCSSSSFNSGAVRTGSTQRNGDSASTSSNAESVEQADSQNPYQTQINIENPHALSANTGVVLRPIYSPAELPEMINAQPSPDRREGIFLIS